MESANKITDAIVGALKKCDFTFDDLVTLERPADDNHGDFATNIAMILAKKNKDNPRKIAEKIVDELKKNKNLGKVVDLEKIEVAGPGFINFSLSNEFLVSQIHDISKENYGRNEWGNGKLAIVEYSSPNIAKPFTVGHLRSTVIGDAIANLLEFGGWKVLRDNHLGDWGTQFGKLIVAIKKWGKIEEIEKSDFPVKDLVDLYVKFHEEAEKNPELEDEARGYFKKLEDGDIEARSLWKKCVDWSWKEFSRVYNLLGVKHSEEFDHGRGLGEAFFEDKMSIVVKTLEEEKMLKEGKEGARLVFFENDKFPPIMIIKKDGATLYATRDLATDYYRKTVYKPDLIVNEVGAEQTMYFQQIIEVEKNLRWFGEGQRVHVGHGLYRLKEGKMSTRKGNVIWLDDVLKEAILRATKLSDAGDSEVAKVVGIGALKWNDLKGIARRDIVFDWDEMLTMKGNSGPYMQYVYARAKAILDKATSNAKVGDQVILELEEARVIKQLILFPGVVEKAASEFAPHLLATYLFELATKFNSFYNSHQVIGSDNEAFRLVLVKAVANVVKSGLKVLGIDTVEKM